MATTIAGQAQIRQSHRDHSHTNGLAALAREMSIPTLTQLRSPSSLQWWEWGKVMGVASLVTLAILPIVGYVPHPATVAVLLHIAADYTCQSAETVLQKGSSRRHLLIHALAAGGLPLATAGLVARNPVATLTWMAAGAASHYLVDSTRKLGLGQRALGIVLDQACHVLTILVLVLTGGAGVSW
jgi:hypothetical protein